MTAATARLSERQAWSALTAHHTQIRERHLRKLFADDRTRGERMTLDAWASISTTQKTRITDDNQRHGISDVGVLARSFPRLCVSAVGFPPQSSTISG